MQFFFRWVETQPPTSSAPLEISSEVVQMCCGVKSERWKIAVILGVFLCISNRHGQSFFQMNQPESYGKWWSGAPITLEPAAETMSISYILDIFSSAINPTPEGLGDQSSGDICPHCYWIYIYIYFFHHFFPANPLWWQNNYPIASMYSMFTYIYRIRIEINHM